MHRHASSSIVMHHHHHHHHDRSSSSSESAACCSQLSSASAGPSSCKTCAECRLATELGWARAMSKLLNDQRCWLTRLRKLSTTTRMRSLAARNQLPCREVCAPCPSNPRSPAHIHCTMPAFTIWLLGLATFGAPEQDVVTGAKSSRLHTLNPSPLPSAQLVALQA